MLDALVIQVPAVLLGTEAELMTLVEASAAASAAAACRSCSSRLRMSGTSTARTADRGLGACGSALL